MKRHPVNWMLLIAALLLGAFIFFFERSSETSWQQQRRQRTVFAVYPDTIEQIRLQRNGVEIECTRTGGKWRLTHPADAPVDEAVVRKMIAGMAGVERGEQIPPETLAERGLSPADYGFDNPRARITFKNSRGTFTWYIGRDAPLGDSLYVQSAESGAIIAAPQALLNMIPEDPAWIRARTLFADEPAAVRGIDLRRPEGFLQLRRPENSSWQIQQPVSGPADRQAVNVLLEEIFTGRIAEFITDEKSDLTVYGLESPPIELTLFYRGEQTQTLLIGTPVPDRPDQLYAKQAARDTVFTLPAAQAEPLRREAARLRSRRLVPFPADSIDTFTLRRGEQSVELVRTNRQWKILRPARWPADPDRVTHLLQSFTDTGIETFIDSPTTGQTARAASAPWQIELTADERTCRLAITSPDDDNRRIVRRNDEPALYTVPASLLHDDLADPLFFRDRLVLTLNPAQIRAIDIQTGDHRQRVEKNSDGSFSAGDQTVNAEALSNLMWALNDLRTERYVAYRPESTAAYGLDQPHAEITVRLIDTNTVGRVLLLGHETGGGRYASIRGRGSIFVLPTQTVHTLTRTLTQPAATE